MPGTPSFLLNGREIPLADADATESLLRWLNRHGRHGTKEGCADGDCGACTVAVRVAGEDGRARYDAINSCLLPIGAVSGREIVTVEALADGSALHPVQQAMYDCAGSQCGYCTPGFVMSLFAAYYTGELDDGATEGNLCRCTGYRPIREATALLAAAPPREDRFVAALAEPLDSGPAAPVGRFHNPDTIGDALALKSAHPEATWIAGATDLGVSLGRGREVATAFIALDRIAELAQIDVTDDAVRIGACATLSRVGTRLAGMFPALDQMLPWFAGRQVRNRSTFGGNLGTASPIGDLLPVLLALDAAVELRSARGERTVAAQDFFLDYRRTARDADELIVAVTIPRRPGLVSASYKVAKRQTDDISIVAAVFALELDGEGRVADARLAYGGVAATPRRATRTEALLSGRRLDPATVDEARASLESEFEPIDDLRAGAAYRRALAGNLFGKFVHEHVPA